MPPSAQDTLPSLQQLPRAQLPLVNRFYRAYQRGMKARGDQHVWTLRAPHICAAVCLQPVESGYWLTSLLVAPDLRAQGLGSHLLQQLRRRVSGPIWLFCAPSLLPFYQACGYQPTATLPQPLSSRLQRYQRTKSLIALVSTCT
ncbi:GNAT family N-acetyltransferase [Halopseudomonas maritima]|uniref:GNAT family N-acetyltransferase n=1 Tax=Halopseudomonas maritima TaxID=2918528 RepID=UPI001EEAECB2|nr:GNAT family N-acetyltransferase [Halopseudomonas maritima]UJJ32008.1 GNAT family N-acetyltransferase [Halopseudomonas maritima]